MIMMIMIMMIKIMMIMIMIMMMTWASMRALHWASRLAPNRDPRAWQISFAYATIWSSVVSLVMKLSRSVMMSTQIEQVKSFLLLGTKASAEVNKVKQQRNKNAFIFSCRSESSNKS